MSRTLRTPAIYANCDPSGFVVKACGLIEGQGLFVEKDFGQGDFLINYRGKDVDAKESTSPYAFQYVFNNTSRCVDATHESSGLARYINDIDPYHQANCKSYGKLIHKPDGSQQYLISFKATRPIVSGKTFPHNHK